MNFLKDPKNLRYNLLRLIPVIVFFTSILVSVFTLNCASRTREPYIWIFLISILSSLCVLLVLFVIVAPVKDLLKRAESFLKLESNPKDRGKMIEFYQTISNLIDRVKKYEEERRKNGDVEIAEDLEKLKYVIPIGYMSLTIAHEVKNPLSTIKGMAQLLMEDGGEREKIYGERILNSAKRIESFTKELLDFLDTELNMEEFDLRSLVEDVSYSLLSEFKDVKCDIEGDPSVIFYGDRGKIEQSIYNILRNAFEYESDSFGYVKITIFGGDPITVRIFNRSSQLSAEDTDLIFKPFYTKRRGGKGIGLFVAKKNIELHKGRIEVKSEREGTEILVKLPAK